MSIEKIETGGHDNRLDVNGFLFVSQVEVDGVRRTSLYTLMTFRADAAIQAPIRTIASFLFSKWDLNLDHTTNPLGYRKLLLFSWYALRYRCVRRLHAHYREKLLVTGAVTISVAI
jgi:hypothetical protein